MARTRIDLSSSTRDTLMATFLNLFKVARDDGPLNDLPASHRVRQKGNPCASFRFTPLAPKSHDENEMLLKGAKKLARNGTLVRSSPVTDELYGLAHFCEARRHRFGG